MKMDCPSLRRLAVQFRFPRLIILLTPVLAGLVDFAISFIVLTGLMPWDLIGVGTVSALIIAISGAFYFRRMERVFADVA